MSVAPPGTKAVPALQPSGRPFPWVKLAVTTWAVVAGVILIKGLIAPRANSTYSCFVTGGQDWLAGAELFQRPGITCRYSPLFHVFMIPFWQMPEVLGSTVWRLLNWGVLLAGLWLWRKTFLHGDLTADQRALLFLLILPLAIGSLNNAQANPLVLGLMLLGIVAVARECWSLAAACLVAALLIKLYPLALALLLLLLYPRRFSLPFLFWLAVGLGTPYLLQSPGYVTRQYANWYQVLKIDDRSQIQIQVSYRDLWLLIRLAGQPISHGAYQLFQVTAAAGIAGLCWWHQRTRSAERDSLHWAFELACCWMTVLGPATESCTYILLAPTLAWRVLQAWARSTARLPRALLTAGYALFLISLVANWFPRAAHFHALGLQPLAALVLLAVLLAFPSSLSKETEAEIPIPVIRARKSA